MFNSSVKQDTLKVIQQLQQDLAELKAVPQNTQNVADSISRLQDLIDTAARESLEKTCSIDESATQLRDALVHKPYAQDIQVTQTKHGYERRLQVFTSLIIVAGLITTSTYQAMYAAPASNPKDSPSGVVDASSLDFLFRMLNGLAFMASVVCLCSCLTGLLCLGAFSVCADDPPTHDAMKRVFFALNEAGEQLISVKLYQCSWVTFVFATFLTLAAGVFAALRLMGPLTMGMGIIAAILFVVTLIVSIRTLRRAHAFQYRRVMGPNGRLVHKYLDEVV